jgi:hypothetical protein
MGNNNKSDIEKPIYEVSAKLFRSEYSNDMDNPYNGIIKQKRTM